MIHDIDKFDELPPEKARYVLAETKLKLMNIMSHLELLESRLVNREHRPPTPHFLVEQKPTSVSNSNPAQQ
jgi:hypothetical protein